MITIKSTRDIEGIKNACRLVAQALYIADSRIRPGLKTIDLDREIAHFIYSKGARPAFKGFNGYPANICVSIDSQVVHGIPGERRLKTGEIVSIDIGVEWEGYFGDAAYTFKVGEVSPEKERLMDATIGSLFKGISAAREGKRLSDIGHEIQKYVEAGGFSVVRDLVGHGIGGALHESPQIPNYGEPDQGPRLRAGMVFAIEPMVNAGRYEVDTEDDSWTVVTVDGEPSAHFEHTVLITKEDPEILTNGIWENYAKRSIHKN